MSFLVIGKTCTGKTTYSQSFQLCNINLDELIREEHLDFGVYKNDAKGYLLAAIKRRAVPGEHYVLDGAISDPILIEKICNYIPVSEVHLLIPANQKVHISRVAKRLREEQKNRKYSVPLWHKNHEEIIHHIQENTLENSPLLMEYVENAIKEAESRAQTICKSIPTYIKRVYV